MVWEKGYYPTSLIKLQVDKSKTDISYLTNKNIKIGDRNYIIRRYLEKACQDYRYRCFVKPHPSMLFRKQSTDAENSNIESETNYQKDACRVHKPPRTNSRRTFQTKKDTLHELTEEKQTFRLKENKLTKRRDVKKSEKETKQYHICENTAKV